MGLVDTNSYPEAEVFDAPLAYDLPLPDGMGRFALTEDADATYGLTPLVTPNHTFGTYNDLLYTPPPAGIKLPINILVASPTEMAEPDLKDAQARVYATSGGLHLVVASGVAYDTADIGFGMNLQEWFSMTGIDTPENIGFSFDGQQFSLEEIRRRVVVSRVAGALAAAVEQAVAGEVPNRLRRGQQRELMGAMRGNTGIMALGLLAAGSVTIIEGADLLTRILATCASAGMVIGKSAQSHQLLRQSILAAPELETAWRQRGLETAKLVAGCIEAAYVEQLRPSED